MCRITLFARKSIYKYIKFRDNLKHLMHKYVQIGHVLEDEVK